MKHRVLFWKICKAYSAQFSYWREQWNFLHAWKTNWSDLSSLLKHRSLSIISLIDQYLSVQKRSTSFFLTLKKKRPTMSGHIVKIEKMSRKAYLPQEEKVGIQLEWLALGQWWICAGWCIFQSARLASLSKPWWPFGMETWPEPLTQLVPDVGPRQNLWPSRAYKAPW